ncbi:MAG: hypothetical protein D4R64_14080 [Porphyromonadaceae bacterium]|nr:MAG: hypothetical protein D4R64_14080 [Porphyromonadaceae bacterium]
MDIHKLRNPELARLTGQRTILTDIRRGFRNKLVAFKRPEVLSAMPVSGSFVPFTITGGPQVQTTDQRIELRLPDGIEIILTGTGSLSAVQSILSIL